MKRVILSAVVASFIIPGFTVTASAQGAGIVDQANIAAVCATSVSACEALVAQVIADLEAAGLTDAQLGTELGVVAAAVVQAAQESPALNTGLADVLTDVAVAAPTEAQSNSIIQVADVVETGGADTIDTTTAVGGSPA